MIIRRFVVVTLVLILMIPIGSFWMPESIDIIDIVSASTNKQGEISTDETWTLSMSPIYITGEVKVKPGVVLTINPGVKVLFEVDCFLIIEGQLVAWGTNLQPIVFSHKTSTEPGDWAGIKLEAGSSKFTRISNCFIQYAETGIITYQQSGNGIKGSTVEISYNTIINSNDAGIHCLGSSPYIEHNYMKNNKNDIQINSNGGQNSDPYIANNAIQSGIDLNNHGINNIQTFEITAENNAWHNPPTGPIESYDYIGNVDGDNHITTEIAGGYIDDDTDWLTGEFASTTIRLITTAYIEDGSTLTIDQTNPSQQVTFIFDQYIDIIVKGKLLIEGENKDNLIFKDNNQNIEFFSTDEDNLIEKATFQNINSIDIYNSKVTIKDCTIKNTYNCGVYISYSGNDVTIDNNYFYQNTNFAIYITGGGTFSIKNNEIYNNPTGIFCDQTGVTATIQNNDIHQSTNEGIYFSRGTPTIQYNEIYSNNIGIKIGQYANPTISFNNIYSSTTYGIFSTKQVTASECYWGHAPPFDNDNNAPSDANSLVTIDNPYYITLTNLYPTRIDLNWQETSSIIYESYKVYRKHTGTGSYYLLKDITTKSKISYIDRDLFETSIPVIYDYQVYVHFSNGFELGSNTESKQISRLISNLIATWTPLFTSLDIAYTPHTLYCPYFIDAVGTSNIWQTNFYIHNPGESSTTFNIDYYDLAGTPLRSGPFIHTITPYETLEISPDSDLGNLTGSYWEGSAKISNIGINGGVQGLVKISRLGVMGETTKFIHSDDTLGLTDLGVVYMHETSSSWTTELYLLNTDNINPAFITVKYRDMNGNLISGGGGDDSFIYTIQPNCVKKWKPVDDLGTITGGGLREGSIDIETISTKLVGYVNRNNIPYMELEPMIKRVYSNYKTEVRTYSSATESYFTTIYAKNTGSSASFEVIYYDKDGNKVPDDYGITEFQENIDTSYSVRTWQPKDHLGTNNDDDAVSMEIIYQSGSQVIVIVTQDINIRNNLGSASIPLTDICEAFLWAPYFDEDQGFDSYQYLFNSDSGQSTDVQIDYITMVGAIFDTESKSINEKGCYKWSPDDNINIYPAHTSARGSIAMLATNQGLIGNILTLERRAL